MQLSTRSLVLASLLFGCSSTTTVRKTPPHTEEIELDASTEPLDDAGTTVTDSGKPKDASVDAPKAEWASGEAGKSCADACQAIGKTCTVACSDHRSCGGHDGESPPFAGYACYYKKTTSGGSTFVTNEGRSLKTCDTVASPTWEYFGDEYRIGLEADIFANPVSCCCR